MGGTNKILLLYHENKLIVSYSVLHGSIHDRKLFEIIKPPLLQYPVKSL